VLFRDLDVIERWLEQARQGRFEVVTQNGYIVGAPTYLPAGELALCRQLVGSLPRPSFPPRRLRPQPPDAGAAAPRCR